MTFNELVEECGEFGLYQKFLAFGFLAPTLVLVSVTYWTQVFILIIPPHRCKLTPDDITWLPENASILYRNYSQQCYVDRSVLLQNKSVTDYLPVDGKSDEKIICPYGWVYDFSSHYPTFASENDWVCEDAWKMYVVHTCYWCGAIVGAMAFGFYSDRYGRKKAYQVAVLITLTSDILTIFAKNQISFYVARFFSAMGEGNISTLAFVLVMEYTGPSKRRINLFIWSATFAILSTIMPCVAYGIHNWKYVLIISWIPSLTALILSCFIPESASWLLTRGQLDEAVRLVFRMAKLNGKSISFDHIKSKLEKQQASLEYNPKPEKERKIKVFESAAKKKIATGTEEQMSFLQATIGLLKTPNMRKKTIYLIILWMIACICYNGNSLEASQLPFPYYLAYSIGAIAEIPGNIFCILMLDILGRRWITTGFFLIGGTLGVLSGCVQNPTAVLVMALVMRCCYASSFDIVFTFSSELFPTVVRGRGISVIRTFGSVGSALAPLIVALSEKDALLPLIIFGIMAIFGGILVLFLPETAKQHLSHTLQDGELFGRDQSFWLCPFRQTRKEESVLENSKELTDSSGKQNLAFEAKFVDGVKVISLKSLNTFS